MSRFIGKRCALGMFLFLILGVTLGYAQFSSSVEGVVTDPSGGLLPSAQITLHNTQTGIDSVTQTNASGYYRFYYVASGQYQVIVEARGFARKVIDATVTTNQTAGVNVALSPATAVYKIEVTGEVPPVNPDETRIQATLEAKDIAALPLQNGSVFETLRVAPGVVGIDEDRVNWAVNIGGANPTASANGRTADANLYMLDGASIQSNSHQGGNNILPAVNITPNADMIAEVNLETTTYAVDNSAGSSMHVNFTSKSGTNNWHGDLGFRYSSRGLTAVPDFTSSNSPFARKWWTGALGGPIRKDKTFFFTSYEHQTQVAALSAIVDDTTPEFTQWAQQNFPNSADVNNLMVKFPADRVIVTSIPLTAGKAFPHVGGVCTFPIHAAIGGPITSNVPIPCDLPIQEEGMFNQSPAVNGYQFNIRLDQYFRQGKDRIYLNFLGQRQNSDFLWWHSGYNAKTPSTARYWNVNYTHAFSSTLLNQISVTYQRYSADFAHASQQYETIPFNTSIFGGPFSEGIGFFGTPAPSFNKEHNYVLRNDLTWMHGNHSFKFGFQGTHNDQWTDNSGYLARPQNASFFDWSDFFMDHPFTYNLTTLSARDGTYLPQIVGAQATQFGLYAQDDWKITPNLKLSLGLRWDDYGNPYDYGHGALPFGQVFPGAGSTLAQQFSSASVKQVHNTFGGRINKNLLPRVGFAWSPFGDRKWSVRGGFGLYQDTIFLADVTSSLPSQPPVDLNLNFSIFNPAPLNTPAGANLYGTTPGTPPYGYNYPTVTPLGFDSRGAVIATKDASGNPTSLYPANLTGSDRHLRPQKTALYSLAIEHDLGHNIAAGATYSGSKSWDMWYTGDFNTFVGDEFINGGIRNRLTNEWGAIGFLRNGMSANYNAMILALRRVKGAFSWQGSYTLSKTLDDPIEDSFLTNNAVLADPYNFKRYYGPSNQDTRHRISITAGYELPSFGTKGLMKAVVGGWQVSGVGIAQSGTPFSVYTSAPLSCDYSTNPPTCVNDPTKAGDFLGNGITYSYPNVPAGIKTRGWTRNQYKQGIFPTSAFTTPAGYGVKPTQGNEGRNMFLNPGYFAIDLALHKKIEMPWFSEKGALMLGVEGTNILNRANLGSMVNNATGNGADLNNNSSFATINNANQARIFQLVARFEF